MSDEQAGSLNKACPDYRCSHSLAVSADQWPDDLRVSDIEHRFVCEVCGKRGADVRPDFIQVGATYQVLGGRYNICRSGAEGPLVKLGCLSASREPGARILTGGRQWSWIALLAPLSTYEPFSMLAFRERTPLHVLHGCTGDPRWCSAVTKKVEEGTSRPTPRKKGWRCTGS